MCTYTCMVENTITQKRLLGHKPRSDKPNSKMLPAGNTNQGLLLYCVEVVLAPTVGDVGATKERKQTNSYHYLLDLSSRRIRCASLIHA